MLNFGRVLSFYNNCTIGYYSTWKRYCRIVRSLGWKGGFVLYWNRIIFRVHLWNSVTVWFFVTFFVQRSLCWYLFVGSQGYFLGEHRTERALNKRERYFPRRGAIWVLPNSRNHGFLVLKEHDHQLGVAPPPTMPVPTKNIYSTFSRGSLQTFIYHWHPGRGPHLNHQSQTCHFFACSDWPVKPVHKCPQEVSRGLVYPIYIYVLYLCMVNDYILVYIYIIFCNKHPHFIPSYLGLL